MQKALPFFIGEFIFRKYVLGTANQVVPKITVERGSNENFFNTSERHLCVSLCVCRAINCPQMSSTQRSRKDQLECHSIIRITPIWRTNSLIIRKAATSRRNVGQTRDCVRSQSPDHVRAVSGAIAPCRSQCKLAGRSIERHALTSQRPHPAFSRHRSAVSQAMSPAARSRAFPLCDDEQDQPPASSAVNGSSTGSAHFPSGLLALTGHTPVHSSRQRPEFTRLRTSS